MDGRRGLNAWLDLLVGEADALVEAIRGVIVMARRDSVLPPAAARPHDSGPAPDGAQ